MATLFKDAIRVEHTLQSQNYHMNNKYNKLSSEWKFL